MIHKETQEEKIEKMRQEAISQMQLTKVNAKVARAYLNMDLPENPELLQEVEHQDFTASYRIKVRLKYPDWLGKRKKMQELERCMRFIAKAGGSTSWALLTDWDAIYNYRRADALEECLTYLKGEQAEVYKTAIRAGLCAELLRGRNLADVKAFCQSGKQWETELMEAVQEGSVAGRSLCLKVLARYGGRYKTVFLSCAGDSAKQIRELLVTILKDHREWEPEVLSLLTSRKAREREFAVLVLGEWGQVSCLEEIRKALEQEKNKKIKGLLEELARELENKAAEESDTSQMENSAKNLQRLAAEIYRGARKKKVEWVQGISLPEVHFQDKTAASEEYLMAILAVYADMDILGTAQNAEKLAGPLEYGEMSAYMQTLFEGWELLEAEAKKRWVLYAAAIHGGEEMIPVLYDRIKKWAEHSRGVMAAEAVRALALNKNTEALLLVSRLSRRFRHRQVRTAAAEALFSSAKELGISREELEDNLVLQLDSKKLEKQQKSIFADQKLRLEEALWTGRLWKTEKWKKLFVENPVMQPFSIGLIWGICENGVQKQTFRYMGDGSFNTAEGEGYELPETGEVRLVHPLALTEDERQAWREQLSDYETEQPILQLERPFYQVTEEEREREELERFEGKYINSLSLSGKLLGMGWQRGEIQDAGFFEKYRRIDGESGAELTFSGSSVGYENEEVTLHTVSFYQLRGRKTGDTKHSLFRKENKCILGDVKEEYFSEIIFQIAGIIKPRL